MRQFYHIVSGCIGIIQRAIRNYQLPITKKANHSNATGFDIMSLRLPIIISRDTARLTLSVSEISLMPCPYATTE